MSFQVLQERCIGCGACDFSCPTNALTKTDSFLGLFEIDPYTCDDCGICVGKCPERAIVSDAAWPVCHGHGCPLTSTRLAEVQCSIWQRRCPSCGTTMWSTDGSEFSCPKCDDGRKVSCPKTRMLEHEHAH
ncbi:MAG: 4Fe-4S binding protein [Acidimicrobiales bacterium]